MNILEGEKEKILKLYTAIKTIDRCGRVYDPKVLDVVDVGNVVRIYFTVDNPNTWGHDAPFVKVIDKEGDELLCEVEDINRKETDQYPLEIYEKIWIRREHIIEIPIEGENKPEVFRQFLTKSKVTATGPLYTVDYQSDDSDTDSGYSD
jgi:hypothetical protein